MRRLNTHDVFIGMRLIKTAGVKDALAGITGVKKADQNKAGFELIAEIVGNLGDPKAEMDALEFLSGPLEIPVAELKTMDALELMGKLEELLKVIEPEEWKRFFNSVLKLTR